MSRREKWADAIHQVAAQEFISSLVTNGRPYRFTRHQPETITLARPLWDEFKQRQKFERALLEPWL